MSPGQTDDGVLLRWRNAVFLIFWLAGFLFASWASRVPNVRDILGASTSEVGVLLFGLAAGSVLGLLASSHIIARLGATSTIRICLTAASLGLVLVGVVGTIVPGLVILFCALLAFGVGYSVTDVAMNLSGAANERRIGKTLMPIYHAAFSLGTMLGAGFGALTLHLGVPLGAHLIGVGLAAVATTLIAVRFLQPAEHVETADSSAADPSDPLPAEGWRSRLAVWRSPRILLIGLIVLGMAFAEGSANDWLSLSMVDGYGVTNAGGAAVFGVFVTAMTLGRLFGGKVLDRFGRIPVLRGTAVLAVVGLTLVILGPNLPGGPRRCRPLGARRLAGLPGRHVRRRRRPADRDRERRRRRHDRLFRVPDRPAADRCPGRAGGSAHRLLGGRRVGRRRRSLRARGPRAPDLSLRPPRTGCRAVPGWSGDFRREPQTGQQRDLGGCR